MSKSKLTLEQALSRQKEWVMRQPGIVSAVVGNGEIVFYTSKAPQTTYDAINRRFKGRPVRFEEIGVMGIPSGEGQPRHVPK